MTNLDLRSNLKAILREQGMSQLELAQKINISPTNLNTRLARGRNCQLSLLEDICQALKVDLKQLMYGDNAEDPIPTVNHEEESDMLDLMRSKDEIIALLKDKVELLEEKLTKKVVPIRKSSNGE
jgi:DNA-binding Xre family transcriptional regulator